jgi:PAS domain S-box-containing protein
MKPRILIIDDQQSTLDFCSLLIGAHLPGFEPLLALNGLQGLALARSARPEVILLDVKMPEIDGYEVCRRLKADPATSDIPVLMISGVMTGGRHRAEGFDSGADGYLVKPFEPEEMVSLLRSLLRLKKLSDEQKAHEKSLQEGLLRRTDDWEASEQKFQMLFDHSPDAIFLESLEGTVLDVNPAGCRLHGLTREALIGRRVMDLIPPETRAEAEQLFPQWFSGELTHYTGRSLAVQGRIVPVEIRASRLTYAGQPAVLLHVRDLRDRERAQFRLTRLNECLLGFGPSPLININRLTALLGSLLNADGALYSRRQADQLCALGAWNMAPEFQRIALNQGILCRKLIEDRSGGGVVRRHLQETGDRLVDLRIRDGGFQTYVGQGVKVKDSDPGALALFFRKDFEPDADDLKLVGIVASAIASEEERLHLEGVLRHREEIYRMLIEAAPLAVLLIQNQRIVFSNPSAARLLGFDSATRLLTLDPLCLVARPERAAFENRLAASENGLPTAGPFETELTRENGTTFPAEEYITSTKIAGLPTGQIIWIDISRRRLAEAALKTSEEQLRLSQKMDALGRLSGGVAHDFNNLLTSILGYAHLIGDDPSFPAALREDILEIVHAGERASHLTHHLLAFSRHQPLRIAPIDLNQVILNIDRLLRRTIGTDIELITLPGENLGTILADAGQMEQVLMNLAVNAREAMPRGGKLTLRTRRLPAGLHRGGEPRADSVLLEVTDTGCGMSLEVRQRAFEPLFTTRKSGEGTGLGLSIVYGIVQHCGGQIELESEPDRGTRVRILFPRLDVPAESSEAPDSTALPRGTETLLVVEDDPALRRLTSRYLRGLGYRILEGTHGAEGLSIFREKKDAIQLVLSDIVMPMMTGPEMVRLIREERPEVRILFVTGFMRNDEAPNNTPFCEVLLKPFSQQQLAIKVRGLLDAGPKLRPDDPPPDPAPPR